MNKSEKYYIETKDNTKLSVICWKAKEASIGIIQIVHGMAEHKERYEQFAQYLNERGYNVYAHDHRGHGETAKKVLGFFDDENGWIKVREDIYEVNKHIKLKENDLPIYLFGHSMGSFLVRDYIQEHGDLVTGVILSGTAGRPGIQGYIGKWIAKREARKNGNHIQSKKLDNIAFGNYNKKCLEKRTSFDWLSRDQIEVDKYILDPYCGFVCSAKFFEDLLGGLIKINSKKNIKKIPKNLPIFLISGTMDPVGDYKRGVLQVYLDLAKSGIKDVTYKFYEGARHELINEINREEVFEDVYKWLLKY